MICSPWPAFTAEEASAVQETLLSNRVNYWTGEHCREFEKEFAAYVGTTHAVALANGTVALDVALRALAIGPGDDVIVTPRTFIASVSCVVNAGARPVFADVCPESGNLTAATIERALTPRTRAVICVHLAGWPCDMDPIMALAARHGLKVIEDCAQAHGARYKGKSVGSLGHIGAWSFCQDKIMTTGGEGGMVTTNDASLWSAMWSFKDHGKDWNAVYQTQHPPGFRWVVSSFGTNWRMLEMQGVIGRVQLRWLDDWIATRTRNAKRILDTCAQFDSLHVPTGWAQNDGSVHAFYKSYVHVRPERLKSGWDRDRIIAALGEQGVPCFQGSCSEVYLEAAFDDTGWRPQDRLPVARLLGEISLMFLVHPTLSQEEVQHTCDCISTVLTEATAPA
nr:DegT/DnrJ/EryC1/StrS aminotransferase family protein [Pigmentiphaga litoralis]